MLLALLALSTPAHADPIPASMTVGAFGLIDTAGGGWLGEYVYFGPAFFIPMSPRAAFIPSLTFEVSPELGNWGFVFTPTFEWAATEKLGVDLVPSIIQDTKGGGTAFIAGIGPGATYLFRNSMSASVAVQGVNVLGTNLWTVNPIVQIGIPIP